eukprot:Trichotokara_eunicae@DN5460_c0_g1_i1.p1
MGLSNSREVRPEMTTIIWVIVFVPLGLILIGFICYMLLQYMDKNDEKRHTRERERDRQDRRRLNAQIEIHRQRVEAASLTNVGYGPVYAGTSAYAEQQRSAQYGQQPYAYQFPYAAPGTINYHPNHRGYQDLELHNREVRFVPNSTQHY